MPEFGVYRLKFRTYGHIQESANAEGPNSSGLRPKGGRVRGYSIHGSQTLNPEP